MAGGNSFAIFKGNQTNRVSLYLRKFSDSLVRLVYQPPLQTPLSQQYLSIDMHEIVLDRRLTFEKWPVAFIDKNKLASAVFYYRPQ
jgi:hypothetical protein